MQGFGSKTRSWLGGASVLVAPGVALAYALRRGTEPPEATPQRFVDERMRKHGHAVVACLGASLVHGRVGASFVDVLSQRLGPHGFQFVNAGVNGDLAYNAGKRLDSVVACDPDVVIVLVGSNDVMAGLGVRRALTYRYFKSLPHAATIEWFRENLCAIADGLSSRTRARIAFSSLPTLGERIDAAINAKLLAYNAVIRVVADEVGAAYIPLHEHLDEFLEASGHANGPEFAGAGRRMMAALLQHYVRGRSWDEIARTHGYAVFIDGVHVGDRGAELIADAMERFLLKDHLVTERLEAIRAVHARVSP